MLRMGVYGLMKLKELDGIIRTDRSCTYPFCVLWKMENGKVTDVAIGSGEFIIKEHPDVEVIRIQPANTKNGIVLAIETV